MWKKEYSSEKLKDIDTTISKKFIYIRRNFKQLEDGTWENEYTTLDKDIYNQLEILNSINQANIDYIAMMTDVELGA